MHLQVLVFVIRGDHENIATSDRKVLPIDHMHRRSLEDNHQLIKSMTVKREFRLGITNTDLQRKGWILKEILLLQQMRTTMTSTNHGQIVLYLVRIVKADIPRCWYVIDSFSHLTRRRT